MDWIADPQSWIAFATLVALELVLGVDNVIFISILAGKLPEEQRKRARVLGLAVAVVSRLLLLLSLSWVIRLTEPFFTVRGFSVSTAVLPAGLLAFGFFSARAVAGTETFWVDTLIIAEAVSIAGALNVGVKYLAGRQRPYAYYGRQPSYDDPYDRNVSFYSGHTSMAFASAAAAGTVYLMRGYRGAPWVLGGGLAVAAFTGYLRIAADKHWFTDVLVGAAVGSLVGWAVPYLFHRPDGSGSQGMGIMPAPGGTAFAF